ncbi:HDOD domain-containing protein [Oceaniserpentilla sp. 4NH20-0058]|uniref:EAL and HDOD domain-containing protein n=1 Tax=Oceaniserpentilla sp. 4NH20-0058 TaxID=3127660 RepID=UPI00310C2FD4
MNNRDHVLLARQPIYNKKLEIHAYELLFRSNPVADSASFTCGDKATSQVLLNAFGEVGLSAICGNHKAYINFTKNLILEPPPFDPSQFVIEILEDIEIDQALINALSDAKKNGSSLALDDFILNHNSAPLLHMVDIVKIDVLAMSRQHIERFAKAFIPRNIILLAEKIETHEMFEFCKDIGFELFQGYFLSKPQNIEGHSIPENKAIVLKLLKDIQNQNINASNLAETINQDPQISYKLLKLVNSAAFTRMQTCTSLQQAITLLGLKQLRSWVTLIALGNLEDKPVALHQASLERAVICRRLGEKLGEHSVFDYYTVGLFSLLDAYFDRPLLGIIKSLNLPDSMIKAITNEQGKLGLALHSAKCFQTGKLDELKIIELEKYNLCITDINQLYKDCIVESDAQSIELK